MFVLSVRLTLLFHFNIRWLIQLSSISILVSCIFGLVKLINLFIFSCSNQLSILQYDLKISTSSVYFHFISILSHSQTLVSIFAYREIEPKSSMPSSSLIDQQGVSGTNSIFFNNYFCVTSKSICLKCIYSVFLSHNI